SADGPSGRLTKFILTVPYLTAGLVMVPASLPRRSRKVLLSVPRLGHKKYRQPVNGYLLARTIPTYGSKSSHIKHTYISHFYRSLPTQLRSENGHTGHSRAGGRTWLGDLELGPEED